MGLHIQPVIMAGGLGTRLWALSRAGRVVMPASLYDPCDNCLPENSHVIPPLSRRFPEAIQTGAKEVIIWASGTPMREFLHVDAMAAASVHVMELTLEVYQAHTQPMFRHINVGTGVDCTIRELVESIARVAGFTGQLVWDNAKPDVTPRKLMDVAQIAALGWRAAVALEDGLKSTLDWYRKLPADGR